MPRGGRALVGFQAIDVGGQPLPNFFRFVASNCDTVSREHIDEMPSRGRAALGYAHAEPATVAHRDVGAILHLLREDRPPGFAEF